MSIWTSLLLTQGHVADPKLAASLMSESSEKETQSARDFAGETHIEGREPSMTSRESSASAIFCSCRAASDKTAKVLAWQCNVSGPAGLGELSLMPAASDARLHLKQPRLTSRNLDLGPVA